ncbi:hypothetical protein B7R21_04300 [Subtercola boreus]|uniref:Glycosyltransferase RgtA/B/C/D-like domain-containing protein n=1 Tax=Subtercola boreus TaxID=120213 RepID=A0A3E0W159_9MICO|nr:hypothetical protein [Subtercola boreus]RFA15253.1 hypothetical protein B7R21_04300 [Subtercola boreus]
MSDRLAESTETDTTGNASSVAERGLRIAGIAFWVLLAAGLLLRLLLVFTPAFYVDSDNAIVSLMAKDISDGDLTFFFWGQTYGGTLLQLVAGGVMAIVGAHIEVLSVVAMLFFVGGVLVLRFIATKAFGPLVGNVAAILYWFSGFYTLRISISEPGFYGPSLVLGLGATALALRQPVRRPLLQWALVGLAAGLAFWQSPMGAALAIPGVLILLVRSRRHWYRILVGIAAAIVGALPWLVMFANSLNALAPKSDGTHPGLRSFATLFTSTMPSIFSAQGTVVGYLTAALCLALFALLAVLAVLGRNAWVAALLAGTVLAVVVVVIGAGTTLGPSDYRYTVFVLPSLAVAVAWLVTRIRYRIVAGITAMVLAATLTVVQVESLFPNLSFGTQSRYIIGDIRSLGQYLEDRNLGAVYADYWVAYSLTAATEERVTAAGLTNDRYPPYQQRALQGDEITVVVLENNENDTRMQVATDLPPFTRAVHAGYAIYTFPITFDVMHYPWSLF